MTMIANDLDIITIKKRDFVRQASQLLKLENREKVIYNVVGEDSSVFVTIALSYKGKEESVYTETPDLVIQEKPKDKCYRCKLVREVFKTTVLKGKEYNICKDCFEEETLL